MKHRLRTFITSHHTDPDIRRRQTILQLLLSCLCAIGLISTFVSLLGYLEAHGTLAYSIYTLCFTAALAVLLLLSKRGYPHLSSYLFIGLLIGLTLTLAILWGFMLPQALLFSSLVIVMFGVLIGARASVISSIGAMTVLVALGHLQTHDTIKTDMSWLARPFVLADALGYGILLLIIGLVSWLSNKETDRSLHRARASEAALKQERDLLEIKVFERTAALEREQLARVLELERFAEVGRISSTLLHELANPLTAATIYLDDSLAHRPESIDVLRRSVSQMERYLLAARKQIQNQNDHIDFSVKTELESLIVTQEPVLKRQNIKLVVRTISEITLHGDPVSFSHAISNLLSFAAAETLDKTIRLSTTISDEGLDLAAEFKSNQLHPNTVRALTNSDTSLGGLQKSRLRLGLWVLKKAVLEDFNGSVSVSHNEGRTTITLHFQ